MWIHRKDKVSIGNCSAESCTYGIGVKWLKIGYLELPQFLRRVTAVQSIAVLFLIRNDWSYLSLRVGPQIAWKLRFMYLRFRNPQHSLPIVEPSALISNQPLR